MTLYQTLEVSNEASKETINAAYRSLAKRFHPDINSTDAAKGKMAAITEAYSILSDEEKRKAYDEQLKRHTETPQQDGYQTPGSGRRGRRTPPQPGGIPPFMPHDPMPGILVEDLALGLLETYLLPTLPHVLVETYPLARKDIRHLLSTGIGKLVSQ